MTPDDPFEWLRSRNPVSDPSALPEPQADPTALGVLRRIRTSETGGRGRRHRRLGRRLLIPVAVGAALATTAAAAWVLNRPPDDPTQVACFREVDLSSSDIIALTAGSDPIAQCGQVWDEGEFAGSGSSPELAPCVLPSGIVGVFPAVKGDPCVRLGLDAADLTVTLESAALLALQKSLVERFARECVPIDGAAEIVESEIDRAGLHGWAVTPPDARPPARPCASVSIDAPTRTVTLVPIPARPVG